MKYNFYCGREETSEKEVLFFSLSYYQCKFAFFVSCFAPFALVVTPFDFSSCAKHMYHALTTVVISLGEIG